jgi:hypothetical protein
MSFQAGLHGFGKISIVFVRKYICKEVCIADPQKREYFDHVFNGSVVSNFKLSPGTSIEPHCYLPFVPVYDHAEALDEPADSKWHKCIECAIRS